MSPSTEAGRRLLEWVGELRSFLVNERVLSESSVAHVGDAILAIEAEAEHRGYLRANDCDHSECIEHEEQALAQAADALASALEKVETVAAEARREARAALLAELEAGVAGLRVKPRKVGEHGWERGYRDSRNDTIAAVLDLIRKAGERADG